MKLSIKFFNDYIAILQGTKEIVGWDLNEWIEDPQIVFSIGHAIQLALKNPKKLVNLLNQTATKQERKEYLLYAIP